MTPEERNGKLSDEKGQQEIKPVVTPIEVTHPEHVDPRDIRLFREPPWRLRMTIEGDRSYLQVKVARAAPLSYPSHYICFLDSKDEVICTVKDPSDLDARSRHIVQEEIARRYLTSVIRRISSVRSEFGASYWDVETNRGRCEFVVKDISENAHWIDDGRLLLIDVDGNRFEIPDITVLDKKSAGFLDMML
jgi:hypothetical protein